MLFARKSWLLAVSLPAAVYIHCFPGPLEELFSPIDTSLQFSVFNTGKELEVSLFET